MAITPADIEQQTFSPSKHGYDTEEVDAFLEQLSAEVDAMLQKIADLPARRIPGAGRKPRGSPRRRSFRPRGHRRRPGPRFRA